MNSKKNSLKNYQLLLSSFSEIFDDRKLDTLRSEEILTFLTQFTEGTKQSTKRLRYSLLSSFFNFIKNSFDPEFQNPCDTLLLRKVFRGTKPNQWKIIDKEVVDEIIFRTDNLRNRVMLELMARAGMRVGEVLKLKPKNIEDRKLIISDPKSGREAEAAFIPKKVADRLKEYIRSESIEANQRIFPITYQSARIIVKKAGNLVGIDLKPHDLRRHAATYASRSGTPIEIVSKVILRHANLATTQRYLGKISDLEAMKWIDNLHG
jgi:integrase